MVDLQYKTIEISINDINVGDTVIHNGNLKTVSNQSITTSLFYGRALWGDNYRLQTKLIKKVLFPKFHMGKLKGFY